MKNLDPPNTIFFFFKCFLLTWKNSNSHQLQLYIISTTFSDESRAGEGRDYPESESKFADTRNPYYIREYKTNCPRSFSTFYRLEGTFPKTTRPTRSHTHIIHTYMRTHIYIFIEVLGYSDYFK